MTHKFVHALAHRFDGLDCATTIRDRVTTLPPALDLASVPEYMIETRVRDTLSELYLPTSYDILLLQDLVRMAKAHCESAYRSDALYLAGLYTPYQDYVAEPKLPVCLTGLAGVGKSSVLRAMRRLLGGPVELPLDEVHGPVSTLSHWHVQVQARATASALLGSLVRTELNGASDRPGLVIPLSAKTAFKRGVSLFFLDELQFLTQSASANTAVTKLLYQLVSIGVPTVFVANYSLCRLLQNRPEQDRQRLLAKPFVLPTSTPDSADWLGYLGAVQRTLRPSLSLDLQAEQTTLFQLTAGLKRLLVHLLTRAFFLARQKGQHRLELSHISSAYDDTEYSTSRRQAEAILRPYSTKSSEYECPFPLPKAAAAELLSAQRHARSKEILTKIQRDALHVSQKKPIDSTIIQSKPTRKLARPKLTADELRKSNMQRLNPGPVSKGPEPHDR
ncbi:hypothetical protein [Eoetvoesiella caeni]|uniref:TniB protein n=1 Tax=Eoetvoesiella caeni TaxID=645616 RepID=A0A366H341_9BURK|nr:hypothetical protein [Eoetvoesiella caeni]MCI2811002.1 hypothetical protein [Eoetvoesiella caeni]NYT56901.1 hypothetical protein [Eoetvoesiella caeni]RBP35470.1 hypothetical protein DFR37_11774 [Eoetvoesiella caeni]